MELSHKAQDPVTQYLFGWSKSWQIVRRPNAKAMLHPFYVVHVPRERNSNIIPFLNHARKFIFQMELGHEGRGPRDPVRKIGILAVGKALASKRRPRKKTAG